MALLPICVELLSTRIRIEAMLPMICGEDAHQLNANQCLKE